jgi:hypothetical protein
MKMSRRGIVGEQGTEKKLTTSPFPNLSTNFPNSNKSIIPKRTSRSYMSTFLDLFLNLTFISCNVRFLALDLYVMGVGVRVRWWLRMMMMMMVA